VRKDLPVILILILLVIISQYYLLHDSLTLGFKPDDWILYFAYKTLGSNPLSQLASVWGERGLYTTYQVYYMGLLDSLFGLNYYAFHLTSLILKMIATIGLYPLILILSKNKLLAVLTVVLFSISHASVGPLEFVVKGSDYLAIIWMEAFLFLYYQLISNRLSGLKYYFSLFVLFIFTFSSSPIRMFPLFAAPFLIEIFWILRHSKKIIIKESIIRLSILYLPITFVFFVSNSISLTGNAYGPVGIFKKVLEGNWYLGLAPFSGVGYSFITNDYWRVIFGSIMVDNFKNYLSFLSGGPTIITGMITALISWCLITRGKILFFSLATILNFILQILFFFISSDHSRLSSTVNYDSENLYSVIFGGYILVIGTMAFLFWLRRESSGSRLLALLWIGSAFLFIFTVLTWAFAPLDTRFSSTNYYLVVASIGSSLMNAAFLVSIYENLKSRLKLLAFLPFLILILIFQMSSREIRTTFFFFNQLGRGAEGQIQMQKEARYALKEYKEGNYALVYFDTSGIKHGQGPFYSEGFLTSFPIFMLLRENKLVEGCIGIIYGNDVLELKKTMSAQNGIEGFKYRSMCIEKGKSISKNLFFSPDQFYAFKINNKKLINIKKKILDQLEINYSR